MTLCTDIVLQDVIWGVDLSDLFPSVHVAWGQTSKAQRVTYIQITSSQMGIIMIIVLWYYSMYKNELEVKTPYCFFYRIVYVNDIFVIF